MRNAELVEGDHLQRHSPAVHRRGLGYNVEVFGHVMKHLHDTAPPHPTLSLPVVRVGELMAWANSQRLAMFLLGGRQLPDDCTLADLRAITAGHPACVPDGPLQVQGRQGQRAFPRALSQRLRTALPAPPTRLARDDVPHTHGAQSVTYSALAPAVLGLPEPSRLNLIPFMLARVAQLNQHLGALLLLAGRPSRLVSLSWSRAALLVRTQRRCAASVAPPSPSLSASRGAARQGHQRRCGQPRRSRQSCFCVPARAGFLKTWGCGHLSPIEYRCM